MARNDEKSKIICFVGFIAAVAAAVTGVVLLVTKLVKKKNEKKYYIECETCDDEALPEETEQTLSDAQTEDTASPATAAE